jgi:two-component system chemotaxis response regulator CheB
MRLGEPSVAINDQLGEQAPFTCPDCGGPLWRLSDPPRFRCQVGHAYHDDVLVDAQAQASTQALWVAARTLDERARMLFDMARRHRDQSHVLSAASYNARAEEVSGAAREIRRLLGAVPTTPDDPSTTEDS